MKFQFEVFLEGNALPPDQRYLWSFENIGNKEWEHLQEGIVSAATGELAMDYIKKNIEAQHGTGFKNYNRHEYKITLQGLDLIPLRKEPFLIEDWNHG